jgi:LysR family glycine cleavage system transcriptional activator
VSRPISPITRFCTTDIDDRIPGYVDWPQWLASAGVAHLVDASHGPRFSHTFLALQAASSGQGVALATSVLAGEDFMAGRLVRPFAHEVRGIYQYFVVAPRGDRRPPADRGLPRLAQGTGAGDAGRVSRTGAMVRQPARL